MLYETRHLTQSFKGKKVLDLARLRLEKSKIYALTGANGAGKSTLLNLLSFLDKPTSGEIYFCGERVKHNRHQLLALRRRVVLVDQYPIHFTGPVWKNVEFGLKIRGISKQDRTKRTKEVLELVGMEEFEYAEAHNLSGGESKRLALARALAINPEVLLCDEPTANVDMENQEAILNILKEINTVHGTSIILSTHYLSQSRKLAHHTLVLEHGQLADTRNENIFKCESITEEGDILCCKINSKIVLHLSAKGFTFQKINKSSKLLIDSKRIKMLQKSEEPTKTNTLPGTITHVEKDNGNVRITVNCGITLYLSLTMDDYLMQKPMIGEQRTMLFPDGAIRFSMKR